MPRKTMAAFPRHRQKPRVSIKSPKEVLVPDDLSGFDEF